MSESENKISRRRALSLFGGGFFAAAVLKNGGSAQTVETHSAWNEEWDKAIVNAAVRRFSANFDEAESLLRVKIGPAFRIHTKLRNTAAHQTRESLEFALLLLETGEEAAKNRAIRIIERVIALQNVDPDSKFYGIWGWFAEEPPEKMSLADFNWANFNGAWLLLVYLRHAATLPPRISSSIKDSIRHAAISIERRNVSPFYTNIAVLGSFVNCCAADVLGDAKLGASALARLREFAGTVDQTGSFSEYNSPTYTWVTLTNFTRLKSYAKSPEVRHLSEKLHRRLWEHLSAFWHASTSQFAGPMSRCYSTDLGSPLWLQKALNNRIRFVSLADIKAGKIPWEAGETGISEYRCPPDLLAKFFRPAEPNQHREIFIAGDKLLDDGAVGVFERTSPVRPVQGTRYQTSDFSLGTANRSDFWIQRRPMLLYSGDSSRPSRNLQLRVVKDEYDFASALFYSVQQQNCVLAAVNFRTPGGDKHPTVDPLPNGEFKASRLFLQFLFSGVDPAAAILVNGNAVTKIEKLPRLDRTRISFELGTCRLAIQPRFVQFGNHIPTLRLESKPKGQMAVELDLLSRPDTVRLKEIGGALAVFTLNVESRNKHASLAEFDSQAAKQLFEMELGKDRGRFLWKSPAGELELTAGRLARPIAEQDAIFGEKLNGKSIPLFRLNEAKLVS